MIENDYGIILQSETHILERMNQTIGNVIWTFSKENLDEENPWGGI
jgi:hypothetical protein